jgi:hypothetical protein
MSYGSIGIRSSFLFEHDLFGKLDSTRRVNARGQAFPDHASSSTLKNIVS